MKRVPAQAKYLAGPAGEASTSQFVQTVWEKASLKKMTKFIHVFGAEGLGKSARRAVRHAAIARFVPHVPVKENIKVIL